ncbi:MAG: MgtC/SapB family protein [Christensenellales bacterium]
MLVCLGACMIALAEGLFTANIDTTTSSNVTYNFGRLCAQVISGIGFLGAGTIFTQRKKIAGLTTAASLWNTACLGIVTGYGYYWLSVRLRAGAGYPDAAAEGHSRQCYQARGGSLQQPR